jgi:hypothetical protein
VQYVVQHPHYQFNTMMIKQSNTHYASDENIQTLMIGRLEDSGHSNVAARGVLTVYADIMLSKHVMTDVLEQYVLAHILKRDIWYYNADSPAEFPCLQYSLSSMHLGPPMRLQYCKILKHYNALLEQEQMAQTPIIANTRLEHSGLSINFSNAYSDQLQAPMHDAGTSDVRNRANLMFTGARQVRTWACLHARADHDNCEHQFLVVSIVCPLPACTSRTCNATVLCSPPLSFHVCSQRFRGRATRHRCYSYACS